TIVVTGSRILGNGFNTGFAIAGNPAAMTSGGMGAAGATGAGFLGRSGLLLLRAAGTAVSLIATPSNGWGGSDPCKNGELCAYDPVTGTWSHMAYVRQRDEQRMLQASADQGNGPEDVLGADTKGTPDGPDGDEENKRGVGGKGWRGDKGWRNAVDQVSKGGTH